MDYIETVEYYLIIKKNEILPFAMTWLDLECITLSEISQSEKDNYHMKIGRASCRERVFRSV